MKHNNNIKLIVVASTVLMLVSFGLQAQNESRSDSKGKFFLSSSFVVGALDQTKLEKDKLVSGLEPKGFTPKAGDEDGTGLKEATRYIKGQLAQGLLDPTKNPLYEFFRPEGKVQRLVGLAGVGDFNLGFKVIDNLALHVGAGFTVGSNLSDLNDKNYYFTDGYNYGSVGITYFNSSGFFITPTLRKVLIGTKLSLPSRVVSKTPEGTNAYDYTEINGGFGLGLSLGYTWVVDGKMRLGLVLNTSIDQLTQVNQIWVGPTVANARDTVIKTLEEYKNSGETGKVTAANGALPYVGREFDVTPALVRQEISYTSIYYGVGLSMQYY